MVVFVLWFAFSRLANRSNGRDKAIFAEFLGIWEISKAHRRRLRELLAQASIDLYRVRK